MDCLHDSIYAKPIGQTGFYCADCEHDIVYVLHESGFFIAVTV